MSYPGFSETEYVSEAASLLVRGYGLSWEQARKWVNEDEEVRFYWRTSSRAPRLLAKKIANERDLSVPPKAGPPMESGYANKYMGRGNWEVVVVDDEVISRAKFKGFTRIDGTPHAVWTSGRHTYAQTAVGPRHPSHWGGL
jgi:hypothetical protein